LPGGKATLPIPAIDELADELPDEDSVPVVLESVTKSFKLRVSLFPVVVPAVVPVEVPVVSVALLFVVAPVLVVVPVPVLEPRPIRPREVVEVGYVVLRNVGVVRHQGSYESPVPCQRSVRAGVVELVVHPILGRVARHQQLGDDAVVIQLVPDAAAHDGLGLGRDLVGLVDESPRDFKGSKVIEVRVRGVREQVFEYDGAGTDGDGTALSVVHVVRSCLQAKERAHIEEAVEGRFLQGLADRPAHEPAGAGVLEAAHQQPKATQPRLATASRPAVQDFGPFLVFEKAVRLLLLWR